MDIKLEMECCEDAQDIDFKVSDKGRYLIDGCCGGCYAAYDIKFCPFCGTKLPEVVINNQ